jgi:DNA uptake protein ComE-like DNA-binding protein
MGIQDRDYMRNRDSSDSEGEGNSSNRAFVIFLLVVGCLYAFSVFAPKEGTKQSNKPSNSDSKLVEQSATSAFQTVNINTATFEELDNIPYVSPALAKSIIAHRPYTVLQDLIKVPGIKERMLEKITPYITLK